MKNAFFLTQKEQLRDNKKSMADIIINTDRGKRHVFNKVTNILNNCYNLIKRPNNKIIFNFRK